MIKDEKTFIAGPDGKLEVVVHANVKGGALYGKGYCAIVCHPHPLHQGTMDNKVATTLIRVYNELGVTAVRFNFRGVGGSEGQHHGSGGEVDDLDAVANWVRSRYPGSLLLLAGFSFGASVASRGCHSLDGVHHLTLVAPPVGRYHFSDQQDFPCPCCIVMGDKDELVSARDVYQWADTVRPRPTVIKYPEATHFFHGHLVSMRAGIVQAITEQLAP